MDNDDIKAQIKELQADLREERRDLRITVQVLEQAVQGIRIAAELPEPKSVAQ